MFLPGIAVIIKIVSIVISSWVIIHLLAAFGVFVAFAYPLWWFIAPKSTVCLYCQAKNVGSTCPFCREKIAKDKHPKNILSVLYNSILLLFFSFVSFGVVYAEGRLLLNSNVLSPKQSVELAVKDNKKYRVNEIFPMEVELSNIVTPINAIQVDISYDPNSLEAVEISTENSFASVFLEREINNEVGFVRLTGGLPNPGYSLERGVFGTVFFRALKPGTAYVEFLPTTVVLANDNRGTNVLKEIPTMSFYILSDPIQNSNDSEIIPRQINLQSNVLGESSNDQIHLYLKNRIDSSTAESAVLGAQEYRNKNRVNSFLIDAIVKIDSIVLSFPKIVIAKFFSSFLN